MQRSNLSRWIGICLGAGAWGFLLSAVGSFRPTDWPSHAVHPYLPVANVCGPVGAFLAYYLFLTIGQGAFPILFFSGVCMVLYIFQSKLTDPWMRVFGLVLLSVSFAAAVHHFQPGSANGFPEGQGGILGIGAATFLQLHFGIAGTRMVLLTAIIVGLLLTSDELVFHAPVFVGNAFSNFKIPELPTLQLPKFGFGLKSLPKLKKKKTGIQRLIKPDESQAEMKPPVLLKTNPKDQEPAEPAKKEAAVEEAEAADPSMPRVPIVVKLPSMVKPRQVSPPPPKELGEYHMPNWECLENSEHGYAESQEAFVREKAAILEQALKEFNVEAHVVEIDTGPVITMYELSLAPGIKVSTITSLSNDIMRSLKAESVRIVAPVPGKNTVGIEVPNAQKEKVRFKELMQLAPEATQKMVMPLFLGKDASGEPLITDLAAMPHCLIAGTTGSGKSVCINTIVMSMMYTQRPDYVKMILIDPKVVEMAPFRDIPHLMCPIINDTARATSVLEWACEKMDERYEILAEAGVRNIKGYNTISREELIERFKPTTPEEEAKIPKHMPYIVIIIDELADLMMTSGKEVEQFIVRLAQKSRAVGIHLILATQRPAATVVTGLIKSNMPTRISFRVQSRMDSRIVMDQNGAELLLGQGDMLFMPPGASKPIRSQGTFIDDKEIRESVKLVKSLAEAQYEPELVQIKPAINADGTMEKDELFDDAVRVVLETKRGSVSLLQRRLTIGYSRASRLIEQMAATGIVGEYKGSQAREAMLTVEEWDAMKAQEQSDLASGATV
jgi:DNA segregation ATPase FtsK/SpoIIIE, S-DNA-T family